MFARHPYRASPPTRIEPPRDAHARPLAWAAAVLLVLSLARVVVAFAVRRFDREVLFGIALACAAIRVLASTVRRA